jgi:hypothetical protein
MGLVKDHRCSSILSGVKDMKTMKTALLLTLLIGLTACNTREWDTVGYNGKARLKIVNSSPVPAALIVDSKFEGTIEPFGSREFGVKPGRHPISLLFATGEDLFYGELRLRSYNRLTIIGVRP